MPHHQTQMMITAFFSYSQTLRGTTTKTCWIDGASFFWHCCCCCCIASLPDDGISSETTTKIKAKKNCVTSESISFYWWIASLLCMSIIKVLGDSTDACTSRWFEAEVYVDKSTSKKKKEERELFFFFLPFFQIDKRITVNLRLGVRTKALN